MIPDAGLLLVLNNGHLRLFSWRLRDVGLMPAFMSILKEGTVGGISALSTNELTRHRSPCFLTGVASTGLSFDSGVSFI